MIACGSCQLQNSLDSSFCRRCGKALDPDLLQQAKSELGRTVAQGYVLFNEGKVEEAFLIAEMALEKDATLATAISLKGMCHERRGELAEALASYERVLEFAPESALDQIKVKQLRASISTKASIVEDERAQPDKKMALAVALLAVLFFGGVGALAFKLLDASQTKAPLVASNGPNDSAVGQGFPDTGSAGAKATAPQGSAPSAQAATASNVRPASPSPATTEGTTGAIPPPTQQHHNNTDDPIDDGGLAPIRPVSGSGTLPPADRILTTTPIGGPIEKTPVSTPNKVDPDPRVDGGQSSPKTTTTQQPPTDPVEDPGQIEINVTSRVPRNNGGGQAVEDSSAAQNLGKVASQEFQLKRYDSAAKKYEKLLKSGDGDQAHVNQRLAQCYENLGKKSDALSAYQRAAKALKENIQAGRGNVTRQKAALESCEAAIKVLNEGA